MQGFA